MASRLRAWRSSQLASIREPDQDFPVTGLRSAPAAEHLPSQLSERRHQRRLGSQPMLVHGYHFGAIAIAADDERVGPLRSGQAAAWRRATDVYVEPRPLPV